MSSGKIDYPGRDLDPDTRHVIAVYNVLSQHVGKDNAITSAEIGDVIDIDDDHDTKPGVRSIVETLREDWGVPIGSSTQGYFVIETPQELADVLLNLKARKRGIEHTEDAILEAVNRRGFAPRVDVAQEVDEA